MSGHVKFSKHVSVIVVFLLALTALSSVSTRGDGNEIVMSYYFERPVLGNGIEVEGCSSYDFNGIRLPVKPLHILIPQGYKVAGINVEKSGRVSLGNPIALSSAVTGIVPEKDFITVGTYGFRGYRILVVDICPVKYVSESDEILYYRHMSVKVELHSDSPSNFRGLEQDRELVKKMVDNPGILKTYRNNAATVSSGGYDYVIITSSEFKNISGSYTFQTLLDSRISQGMNAEIVSVEDIVSNRDYWVNGTWGDNNPSNPFYESAITENFSKYNDTQAKIRNFIRYAYSVLGTRYVLLGGDADGGGKGENIVPVRRLYANETGLPLTGLPPFATLGFEEDNIPSDLYYACLDGNFNYDMDDFWGESASRNGLADADESDFYSEVWVGRAPVDSAYEISNFVMKTLAYEQTADRYTSRVLFLGEYLGFPGVSKYGGNYKDEVKPYIPSQYDLTTMYDREWPGFDPSDPWATGWDKYDLMDVLNNDTPCIINHDGHGFVNYGLRLHNSDIDTLTNDKYFFVYSQTCLAGSFDNCYNEHYYTDDCAAEHFTVETPHGAFAAIMNARYGLGSEDTIESPSGYYDKSFFKALFSTGIKQIGGANQYSKEDNVWQINENGMRWACYETNLFGDPALAIRQPNMGVSIVEPEKGLYLFGNGPLFPMSRTVSIGSITIKVNATALSPDSVDRVEFYVDDVLKSSDNQAPYEWEWDGFAMGTHTVKVTGYSKDGETDSEEMEIFIISM